MKLGPIYKVCIVIAMLLSGTITNAQLYNQEVEASITISEAEGQLTIVAAALNKTELNQSLRYELSVIKGDKNALNKSRNSQKGRIVLAPGEQKKVSQTTINRGEERIILLLLIYNAEEKLLGKDRVVLNDNKAVSEEKILLQKKKKSTTPDVAYNKADGVVLRGIVIEDTKTKLGNDFYRMFYIDYLQKNINGSEIVTIKETLAIGSNTQIEIFVGRDKIFEFVVRPQNSYLLAMKDQVILRVRKYLYLLEKNSTQRK